MWQLSFIDREVDQILDGRDRAIIRTMNPYRVIMAGGVRQAATRMIQEELQGTLNLENETLVDPFAAPKEDK